MAAHVQPLEPRVLLTAVGGEFQVNTYSTNAQQTYAESPQSVAMDAEGNFVVTWTSYVQDGDRFGVYAQRYNAAGVAQGSEFRVNTYTTGSQQFSTVAMDADGDFVITWSSIGQDGNSFGVYAQRYNAAGVAQGSEFQVNTYTVAFQRFSTVAMDADGNFVITWSSNGQSGLYGIYAQRYDAGGLAQGVEFRVSTDTTSNQRLSTVAMDADGDFVVSWSNNFADAKGLEVYAQRYDAAGMAQGGQFHVNTFTTLQQANSTVAMDADGDFVVSWSSNTQDGSGFGIYAQRYNAVGIAQGSEFRVNAFPANQQIFSTVAMDADGDFVVTWTDYSQDGSSRGIYGQRYDAFGVAQGTEFRVNAFTTNSQSLSSVAMDADGDFVVAWKSTAQDGSHDGVFARRFSPNRPPAVDPQFFTIAENRPVGHVVGTVAATDSNAGDSLTYAITAGNTGNVFAINAATGQITVASPTINFESLNQYRLTVQVTDNGAPVALYDTATVTIDVVNLNEAPVFAASPTFSLAENRSVGYVVGVVKTIDPEMNAVTYSLVGGDPNAQFAIDANTGQITVAKATVNFEATPQFGLLVKAQDNGTPANSRTQSITVNVTDLNEAPAFLPPTAFAISENRGVGYFVGDVNAIDPEGNAITYSIVGGDPNAQFAIDSSTGAIAVAKATINFEATPQFLLSVKAQDNGSPANSRTQTVTVNVANLNEAPMFLAPTSFTIRENRPNGTVVGTVTTIDPEMNAVTYGITAGNTNNGFAINPASGQITVNNSTALDFETTPQFLLSVRAQDNGTPSNSRTQTIAIHLTNAIGARLPSKTPSRSQSGPAASATGQQVLPTQPPTAVVHTSRRGDALLTEPSEALHSFALHEPLHSTAEDSEAATRLAGG
ncbi:MAG: cadherin domain-containing protein [Planctomycetaceae bacterium]|nr:cadherin domain-containing protein [Planctomycetaceae bacterium]